MAGERIDLTRYLYGSQMLFLCAGEGCASVPVGKVGESISSNVLDGVNTIWKSALSGCHSVKK